MNKVEVEVEVEVEVYSSVQALSQIITGPWTINRVSPCTSLPFSNDNLTRFACSSFAARVLRCLMTYGEQNKVLLYFVCTAGAM